MGALVKHYAGKGYNVIARSWPGMEDDIEELRRDPSSIATLGVTEVVNHYEAIIRGLDSPPIIMGHSFAGLVTQILLDRGLGAAGVPIATAPVKGILLLPFSTLKVSFPALSNPANNHKAEPPQCRARTTCYSRPPSRTSIRTPPRPWILSVSQIHGITGYKEFPERTHYTLGQAGWEEVAD